MPSEKIKRLQLGRIPLLITMVVSGLMIMRVPLSEFANPLHGSEPQAKLELAVAPSKVKKTAPTDTTPVPDEQTDPVAAANPVPKSTIIAENQPTEDDALESFQHVQETIQTQKNLAASLVRVLPKLSDLLGGAAPQVSVHDEVPVTPDPPAPKPPAPAPEAVVVEAEPEPAGEIVLRNPTKSGGAIVFLVDGELYKLAAGQEVRLPAGAAMKVEFHRGGEFGTAEQYLSEASELSFSPTARGWTLEPAE